MTMGAILHMNHGTSERAKEKGATLGRFLPCRSTGAKDGALMEAGARKGGESAFSSLSLSLFFFSCCLHSPHLDPSRLCSSFARLFAPRPLSPRQSLLLLPVSTRSRIPSSKHLLTDRPTNARETDRQTDRQTDRPEQTSPRKKQRSKEGTRHGSVASQPSCVFSRSRTRPHTNDHTRAHAQREAEIERGEVQHIAAPIPPFTPCLHRLHDHPSISPSLPPSLSSSFPSHTSLTTPLLRHPLTHRHTGRPSPTALGHLLLLRFSLFSLFACAFDSICSSLFFFSSSSFDNKTNNTDPNTSSSSTHFALRGSDWNQPGVSIPPLLSSPLRFAQSIASLYICPSFATRIVLFLCIPLQVVILFVLASFSLSLTRKQA